MLTPEIVSLILILGLVGLMICAVPLGFAAGALATALIYFQFGPGALGLPLKQVYGMASDYSFAAVPMFILMASLLEHSTLARDMYSGLQRLAGQITGGVAIVTLLIAVILAAMSGIIGGEIVLLGLIALPQMLRLKYDRNLAIGTILAGGSLGTMIPPSIVLIIYGLVSGVSIQKLFIATTIPGLMMGSLYLSYILIRCWKNPKLAPPVGPEDRAKMSVKEALKALVPPILLIFLIMYCIYGGITSITEAAVIGVTGALILITIRGEMSFGLLNDGLVQTLRACGVLLWVTFGVSVLVSVYNLSGGRDFMSDLILDANLPPLMTIIMMMLLFLVLGTIMDWIGILLLTMPIFVPIITQLGFDPVWFGVLFCMNMQVAFLSPPFGPAGFYLKSVAPPDISLMHIYNSVWPFILLQIFAITMLILFPNIALWLPGVLMN